MPQTQSNRKRLIDSAVGIALVAVVLLGGLERNRAADRVDFERDVRPILSNHCFQCHGPDDATREADLRLDLPTGLFGSQDEPGVVVPGNLKESLLWERVTADDPDQRMPPAEAHKPLKQEQVDVLRRWIEQGANWRQHWAFVAPQAPQLPQVKNPSWCRTPIDRFILARLERAGIEPAGDASPAILVRRLFLDLIGLPPTVEQAQRWTQELAGEDGQSLDEAALHRLVDYLLTSPHYGEKWAQRWLDLARYADTNGYEKDRDRSIWPYRDWVIRALNDDMPFDQFTIEQFAGDLLPESTKEQRIATGFHCNTMLNEEGGIDPLEFRFYAMTDRLATTGAVWLGLTLGCAQCHSHKFDPITQTEYYRLMALMNNADEVRLELPDAAWHEQWRQNRAKAMRLLARLPEQWPLPEDHNSKPGRAQAGGNVAAPDEPLPDWLRQCSGEPLVASLLQSAPDRRNAVLAAFNTWLKQMREGSVPWYELKPVRAHSSLPILTIQEDNSIFASGDTQKRDDYFIEFAPSDRPVRAVRLEALPDERLPARGPGMTYYEGTLGDFFLGEFELKAGDQPVTIKSASESYAANRFGNRPVSAQLTLDGDVQTGWSVHGRQGERHVAVYVLDEPIPPGVPIHLHMVFGRHFASSLGRFRVSFTDATTSPQPIAVAAEVERALLTPTDSLTVEQWLALFRQFLLDAPELRPHNERIKELQCRPPVTTTLVMSEWPDGHRRPTYRHHRGEYLQPAEEVEPGTPAVLHAWRPEWPKNRLGLARWLVDERNPLTARVVVNRAWADFFGTGLVRTQEDFGLQGEPPTHPELLDWLAVHLIHDGGWSLKKLHRLIVTSRVYRLETRRPAGAADVDPENRLLSSMPRKRLTAEQIRDQMVTSAKCLDRRFGGPPVRPLQAPGISEVAYGNPKWQPSSGGDRYRRSVYTYKKRTAPFAFFATFDAPSGETCTVRRVRSNTPLQALTLLNDVMVIDLARQAAVSSIIAQLPDRSGASKPGGNSAVEADEPVRDALITAFRRVFVRKPSGEEIADLMQFYSEAYSYYAEHPAACQELLGKIEALTPNGYQPDALKTAQPRVAAWVLTWRALWALDEAVMCP